jgi:hypothetical protein
VFGLLSRKEVYCLHECSMTLRLSLSFVVVRQLHEAAWIFANHENVSSVEDDSHDGSENAQDDTARNSRKSAQFNRAHKYHHWNLLVRSSALLINRATSKNPFQATIVIYAIVFFVAFEKADHVTSGSYSEVGS